MLRRIVVWSHDRRGLVVVLWAITVAVAVGLAGVAGGDNAIDYTVPGSDSADAVELLAQRFPEVAGGTVDVVYSSTEGVAGPEVSATVDRMAAAIAGVDHVVGVDTGTPAPGGTVGVLHVRFDAGDQEVPPAAVEQVVDIAGQAANERLRIELGGYPVQQFEQSEAGSESVGLLAALVILLVAFGSVLAAGLPVAIAGLGLGLGLAGVWLLANVVDVPDFGVLIATMIGIGVGVDYALLIVTRFRAALAEGREPRGAVELAGTTAGRSVVLAGSTVVLSVFGLVLMGRSYLWGVALAISLTVASVVLATITMLPALLGFVGRNIDRLRLPWSRHQGEGEGERALSWRWSRVIQRHPIRSGVAALFALALLASPAVTLRLGMPDAGNGPDDFTSKRAYDLVTDSYGPGANGPLLVAVDLTDASPEATAVITAALAATPGVAAVAPPTTNRAGDAAVIAVIPTTGPQDAATEALVTTLRDGVLPPAVESVGAAASVGGVTATFIDESEQTAARLPFLVGGVVILSVLLLMAVFRSLAVALKAAVMNLLSLGAAYGVMALAAGGGWFGKLVGIENATPVPGWLPMMMFAVLFGLSMDYEVFLLSRVREEYLRTRDNSTAVADGLAGTARVITAAAAIMITVFAAFALEDTVFIKLAGLGMAAAVLVDATIVRMVLVPSTMELLGDRNWWLPRWLDRLLPHVDAEGAAPVPRRELQSVSAS
jgi:RND superfamily putative drug exporter